MSRLWPNLAAAFTIVILSLQALPSEGLDAVYCTNCGTEWTQLANKLAMAKQLATQTQQLQTQLNTYKDMLTNSKGFSTQIWGKAMNDFQQLNSLLKQSKALAYSAGNLDEQFGSKYGTYDFYMSKKMGASDWKNKYAQWSKESSDNTLYALKGIGLQASQMQDEQAMMHQLQAMAGSAEGRMQAMQVANMMAAQNVEQVQKLRQLMMMQLQMQANYIAQQQDKEAAQQAASQNYFRRHHAKVTQDGY